MNAFNPLGMSTIHLSTIQLSILTLDNHQAYWCKSNLSRTCCFGTKLWSNLLLKKSFKSWPDCCRLPPSKSILFTSINWIYSRSFNVSDDYRVMGFVLGINLEKVLKNCKATVNLFCLWWTIWICLRISSWMGDGMTTWRLHWNTHKSYLCFLPVIVS